MINTTNIFYYTMTPCFLIKFSQVEPSEPKIRKLVFLNDVSPQFQQNLKKVNYFMDEIWHGSLYK